MIISRRLEFVYIGPPKTASSSLHCFFESAEFDSERFEPQYQHNARIPAFAERFLRIISVRNPYDRVVSLWKHSQRAHAKAGWPPHLSFAGFLDWVLGDRAINFYRSPVCAYLLDARADVVLRIETLRDDLLALPFVVGSSSPPRFNASKREPWPLYYNQSSADLVWEWQRADFERFSYDRLDFASIGGTA